jgi:hypothetical protein
MIPTMALYAAAAGVGLYLVIKDRVLLGAVLLLLAHGIAWAFHKWAERLPKVEEKN